MVKKKNWKNEMKKLLCILCVVFAIAGCDREQSDKTVIKIGGILPLTGGVAQMGTAAKNGAIMAVEQLNKNSQNKYKYEFIAEDIGLAPAKTASTYTKLVKTDNVAGIVSFNTATGKIIKPLADKDKVLHISSAADSSIGDNKFNYVNSYSVRDASQKLVDYMKSKNMKTISLVTFNHVSSEFILQTLQPVLKTNNIKVLSVARVNMEQRDFASDAAKIVKTKPDMVFMHLVEPALTLFSKQMLRDEYRGELSSFLIFAFAENSELFNNQPFVDLKNADDEFNAKYYKRFKSAPQAASINTYDSVMLIANFIEKYGLPMNQNDGDMTKNIKQISTEYTSPRGKMQIDTDGLIYSETTIKKIENGKPVAVKE